MQKQIIFNIILPLEIGHKLKHMKEKSVYNLNYYELPTYGDWIGYGIDNNNILLAECNECYNSYTYSFGRFLDGKFISVLSFSTQEDILNNIDKGDK